MLDFEFFLDTGNLPPLYCRQPVYAAHEKKIMNTHILVLEDDDYICDCVESWGSLLLLASELH